MIKAQRYACSSTSGVGRWFRLRGLQEPFPPRIKWPGYEAIATRPAMRAYFPCAHMYMYNYYYTYRSNIIIIHTIDYVWPAAREIKTNYMRHECFYITLACQEFYGGASPRSPCVSYAAVSHRTSSLPRLLRGRQPPEPPWFLRHCVRMRAYAHSCVL